MRKRINNDFDALVEVLHEGVKIDLSLYEITSVRMVSNQAYQVTDYEVRNGSLFLHVTPLIAPKTGRYKIVVTYRIADPTLADGFWNYEFDKYLVTIVGSSDEEDAGDVVITADAVIGMQGKSAYQVWLEAGNVGTVEDYLEDIKGDKGNYGVVEFVVNENMELEQHTLVGDPLDFAIVDGDLVLNEAGETVNLGTVAIKDTYSYDEQRIGTWVNGKPIYRKVILLPSTNGLENVTITHNLNIDEYIRMDIASNSKNTGQTSVSPLIAYSNVINSEIQNTFDNSILIENCGINPLFTYHLILEYTKLP